MSSFKKFALIIVVVVSLIAVSYSAVSAGGYLPLAKKSYTCSKIRCLAYNSNGTARYSKILGVSYRTFVWSGTTVIGQKYSSGWLVQTGFQSQSVYYIAADFVAK